MLNRLKKMLAAKVDEEQPSFLPEGWNDMSQSERNEWTKKNSELVKQQVMNTKVEPESNLQEESNEVTEEEIREELETLDEEAAISDAEMAAAKAQLAEQDVDVVLDEEMEEMEDLSDEERAELDNLTEDDPEYLEYSAEAVGYENRQAQWDTYRIVAQYFESGDSILDFGAGRGDFERFYQTEFKEDLEYVGIDFNQQLVDAGKKAYKGEVEVLCQDWFKLDKDIQQDWCVNINSSNVRYDADTTRTDEIYLKDTIVKMMQHCNKGSIIILSSDILETDDGLINFNPGDMLNWAQKEFNSVALDHSYADGVFTLVIYK
tara:strand:- start:1599 stop:2555 length:957 start_codon:yes stop_codon:yes gene_type:complete